MRRVGVCILGLVLGSWTASAVGRHEGAGSGWFGGATVVLSMLVFAFVAVSVVTAMETVFPSLRRR